MDRIIPNLVARCTVSARRGRLPQVEAAVAGRLLRHENSGPGDQLPGLGYRLPRSLEHHVRLGRRPFPGRTAMLRHGLVTVELGQVPFHGLPPHNGADLATDDGADHLGRRVQEQKHSAQ